MNVTSLIADAAALAANWETTPFISTGLGDFDAVFSVETVERLIGSGTLPIPDIRLFQDGTQLPVSRCARPGARFGGQRERLVDGAAVEREIASGATLAVEEVQTFSPEVGGFAAELAAETGCVVYCTAFVTPAGGHGVRPHYDPTSVFIRQVYGAKRWRVSQPVQRWPSILWSDAQDFDTEVVLETELRAGQCLYIPRGFVHCGTATGEASVHLAVNLAPPTWASVLRRLADTALDAEPMREALPPDYHRMDPAKLRALLAERLAQLGARLGELGEGPDTDRALAKALPRTAPPALAPGSLRAALGGEP
jgi:bifunctional lysine-specific demethylase and histidyl-hydroxylase NO66